jgi:phosphoribosylanthranilate isomerase
MNDRLLPVFHRQGQAAGPQKNHRMVVKVCGLTRLDQALACARAGADAIGLVFYPPSPRHVGGDQARAICRILPKTVARVGVFVDAGLEVILNKVRLCGLTAVQLHGNEAPAMVEALLGHGLAVIKAVFAARPPLIAEAAAFRPSAFLVECGRGRLPGGNAQQWDWAGAAAMARPFLLAGGLNPGNVADAIAAACPDGVDVSSGVEIAPGDKDIAAVKAFVHNVRQTHVRRPG